MENRDFVNSFMACVDMLVESVRQAETPSKASTAMAEIKINGQIYQLSLSLNPEEESMIQPNEIIMKEASGELMVKSPDEVFSPRRGTMGVGSSNIPDLLGFSERQKESFNKDVEKAIRHILASSQPNDEGTAELFFNVKANEGENQHFLIAYMQVRENSAYIDSFEVLDQERFEKERNSRIPLANINHN